MREKALHGVAEEKADELIKESQKETLTEDQVTALRQIEESFLKKFAE